jgi:hypothetical protein
MKKKFLTFLASLPSVELVRPRFLEKKKKKRRSATEFLKKLGRPSYIANLLEKKMIKK